MVDASAKPITARGLGFAYSPAMKVLDGVDLDVNPSELLVLIGPNGAGKSTLLRILAGLVEPQAGEVLLRGVDARRMPARRRARELALVPQDIRVPGDVTIDRFVEGGRYAHLGFWRQASAVDRNAVEQALVACELSDLRCRRLAETSNGQRQRALVARAMAQEARLLLVDEPTASLDVRHQVSTFEKLLELVREDHAALVVTHELNLASQFATRIAVLDQGRIVAAGSPDEIFRPEVLEPVYGPDLHYGMLPDSPWGEPRPYVLPHARARK